MITISGTLSANPTSIDPGGTVTLQFAITGVNLDSLNLQLQNAYGAGTFGIFNPTAPSFYSGDGQNSDSPTFTYLGPGAFTPSATVAYIISAENPATHFFCSACGGTGLATFEGPTIAVGVPEPATWHLFLIFGAILLWTHHAKRKARP